MILLVSVDMRQPAGSYTALFDALKSERSWWHYMKYTWLIYTDKTPQQMIDKLTPHMKGRGRLLVCEFKRPYQGLLPPQAWEWIRKHEAKQASAASAE